MNTRNAAIVGAVVLLLAAGGLGWTLLGHASPPAPDGAAPIAAGPIAGGPIAAGPDEAAPTQAAPPEAGPASPPRQTLPVPPVPPRVAEGARYEQCLAMLPDDPRGAASFAEGWTDGGEGAVHCHALAEVSLGNAETGAKLLERLAATSHAPPAARAVVFGQAAQAWLMTGNAANAYRASTSALALTPDDADMLVDRAVAAGGLNRFEDAEDDLTRALDADPRRAETLVLRASAWRHLGQLEAGAGRYRPLDRDRPRKCGGAAGTRHPAGAPQRLGRGAPRLGTGDHTGARFGNRGPGRAKSGVAGGRAGRQIRFPAVRQAAATSLPGRPNSHPWPNST